jgi:DNA-binding MarR family transcriptional regulator
MLIIFYDNCSMDDTHPESSERHAVAEALHSAAIRLLRLVRLQDVASGVGPARLSALSVLVFAGAKSLKELAAIEQVRPPTMSRIVEGLERSGLARREVSARDQREIRIQATAKGKKVLLKGRDRRVRFLADKMEGLSKTELEDLARATTILQRIVTRGDA